MKKKTKENPKLTESVKDYVDQCMEHWRDVFIQLLREQEERLERVQEVNRHGLAQFLEGRINKFDLKIHELDRETKELVAFFKRFTQGTQGKHELLKQKVESLSKLGPAIEDLKTYSQALYEDLKDARKRLLVCESKQDVLIQVIKR